MIDISRSMLARSDRGVTDASRRARRPPPIKFRSALPESARRHRLAHRPHAPAPLPERRRRRLPGDRRPGARHRAAAAAVELPHDTRRASTRSRPSQRSASSRRARRSGCVVVLHRRREPGPRTRGSARVFRRPPGSNVVFVQFWDRGRARVHTGPARAAVPARPGRASDLDRLADVDRRELCSREGELDAATRRAPARSAKGRRSSEGDAEDRLALAPYLARRRVPPAASCSGARER